MVTYLNSLGIGSNGVITEADAAAATIVANSANTTVTKFNELKYFTQITESRGGLSGTSSGWVRFTGWTALEEVDISNFTSLGHNTGYGWEDSFANCTNLKKVIASNKLAAIGHNAFSDCTQLEDITGLDGTITVYGGAFSGNAKLKNSNFANVEILFPPFTANATSQFKRTNLITSLVLSDQNTCIPKYCFEQSKIRSINIPTSITTIGHAAFKNSDIQLNVSSLSNVTQFYDSCFANTDLTGTFVFDSNIDIIDQYCFQNTQLQSVDLSDAGNLSFLGRAAFSGCTQLTSVTLPSSMTTLKNALFYGCSALTSINLGNITTFESECLRGCTNLSSVNLDSVTSLGDSAFRKTGLTSLDLSNSQLTEIPSECFRECQNLGLVKLPTTCTILGNGCFFNDPNMQISATDLARITLLGTNCFYNSGLSGEYSLPNLTTINGDPFGKTKITKLDFTGSVFTSIGGYFLNGQTYIQKITFPDTLQTIQGNMLAGCTGLQYIKCLATTPPTAAGSIAGYFNNPTFKIYVPDASVNAYKAATYWSDHSARIFGLSQFATDFPNE